jgi:thymidylate synthase ThyX
MIKAQLLKATRPLSRQKTGLISFQIEVPLYVWTEVLTHRRFARNASSARAMSTERYVDMGYYTPKTFYKQGSGMQSSNEPIKQQWLANLIWHTTTKLTQIGSKQLERLGVAKEQRNRLVAPNKIVRGIVTGTEDAWQSFLKLRNHHTADKAMQELAALINSEIYRLEYWKTDYVAPSGVMIPASIDILVPASGYLLVDMPKTYIDNWTYSDYHFPFEGEIESIVAQVARVSYARTKGKDDKALYNALWKDGHLSPFEHIAYWTEDPKASCFTTKPSGDCDLDVYGDVFAGWESLRARLENSPIDNPEEA